MTQLATKLWTYEEYLALPEDGNRYEIIDGELYMTPPPIEGHQFTSGELFFAMFSFIRAHRLEILYHPPFEVHLSEVTRPVQPDLTFIRTENKPTFNMNYFEGIPDLVVEIFSPSTHRIDQTVKYEAYQKAGVPEYWIIDPACPYRLGLCAGARRVCPARSVCAGGCHYLEGAGRVGNCQ
jgi:Uma2 family endonuclease